MKNFVVPFRALFRLFLFIVVTLFWAILVFVHGALGASSDSCNQYLRRWVRSLVWLMGIQIERSGEPHTEPGIIMSNHRSYIDILLFPINLPVVFLSKAEVAKWPVLGWGAKLVGTVFVQRESRLSRVATRNHIVERLMESRSVILFPEGTTHRGPEVLDLKIGMFKTAAHHDLPILPVAIEYENPDLAWVGDDTFLPHFLRHLGQRKTRVKVQMGKAVKGDNPAVLRDTITSWFNENLTSMRREWDSMLRS